jgi:hypothetical protein
MVLGSGRNPPIYKDDEIAADLKGIKATTVFITQSCYGGGIIDDVSKAVDKGIFISATEESNVAYYDIADEQFRFSLIPSLKEGGSVAQAFDRAVEGDKMANESYVSQYREQWQEQDRKDGRPVKEYEPEKPQWIPKGVTDIVLPYVGALQENRETEGEISSPETLDGERPGIVGG